MALEQIGLQANFADENFQAGIKRYQQGIGQANAATDEGASVMSRLGSVAAGALTVGIAAATAAIGAFVAISKVGLDATLKWANDLDRLGDQFGLSGADASKWATAMQHVGLTVDEGAQGLNFFTKNLDDAKKALKSTKTETVDNTDKIKKLKESLADANTTLERAKIKFADAKTPTKEMGWAVADAQKRVAELNSELAATPAITTKVKDAAAQLTPFQEALKKLGVSAFNAKGDMKDFDTIMPEIMDHFQKLPAGVDASALAMDLFGARGGTKFLDFLRQGSVGLKEAEAFAKEFGLTMSTDTVNAAEQFGFAMNDLNLALRGVWNQIGQAVLPIVRDLVDYIIKNVLPAFSKWAKENAPKITAALRELGKWIRDTGIPTLKDLVKWVQDNVMPRVKDLIDLIVKRWPEVTKQIDDFWKKVEPILREFEKWLKSDGVKALETFYTKMEELQDVSKDWDKLWKEIVGDSKQGTKDIVTDAGIQLPKLADIIGTVMDLFKTRVSSGLAAARQIWAAGNVLIQGDFQGFSANMNNAMYDLFRSLAATIGINIPAIEGGFQAGWNRVLDDANDWGFAMKQQMANALNGMVSTIYSKLNEFVAAGAQILVNMANGLPAGLGSLLSAISSAISSAVTWLWFRVTGAIGDMMAAGRALIQGIIDGLGQMAGALAAAFWKVVSDAIRALLGVLGIHSPSRLMMAIGQNMAQSLAAGFGVPQFDLAVNPLMAGASISLPRGSAGGGISSSSSIVNNFNLSVHSSAPVSTVAADFGILRSLA